jgi:hypothetical protein
MPFYGVFEAPKLTLHAPTDSAPALPTEPHKNTAEGQLTAELYDLTALWSRAILGPCVHQLAALFE